MFTILALFPALLDISVDPVLIRYCYLRLFDLLFLLSSRPPYTRVRLSNYDPYHLMLYPLRYIALLRGKPVLPTIASLVDAFSQSARSLPG